METLLLVTSNVIEYLLSGYLCAAFLVAAGAGVAAEHPSVDDPPARATRCAAAALIGALWPMTIVGLAQFWTISKLADQVRA